ncbi:hypothetical protein ACFSM5_11315 [Lacibacterium aquatile]|uniref:Uncharacterized protein n=1 Tax=Lacibacterium aquatile TaxID=1168082 RepID=A0ABW5DRD1_9PROT
MFEVSIPTLLGSGVVAALCTFGLGWLKEVFVQRRKREFFLIQIAVALEDYVLRADHQIGENAKAEHGLPEGMEAKYNLQFPEPPEFAVEIDWDILDSDIVVQVFSLKNQVSLAQQFLSTEWYYGDVEGGALARLFHEALGFHASEFWYMAERIRRDNKLPPFGSRIHRFYPEMSVLILREDALKRRRLLDIENAKQDILMMAVELRRGGTNYSLSKLRWAMETAEITDDAVQLQVINFVEKNGPKPGVLG